MATVTKQLITISNGLDIPLVRAAVRQLAIELGFNLVDQTKLVTAASELTRNIVLYAGNGTVKLEQVENQGHIGLRATFEDKGPGIPDIEMAMTDGYTTSGGLGYGLGGAKRLVNDFSIESKSGKGTRITITRWK